MTMLPTEAGALRHEIQVLQEMVRTLESDHNTLAQNAEPWVGLNGQARFRLERLEQAFQALVHNLPPEMQAAKDHAVKMLQMHQEPSAS